MEKIIKVTEEYVIEKHGDTYVKKPVLTEAQLRKEHEAEMLSRVTYKKRNLDHDTN